LLLLRQRIYIFIAIVFAAAPIALLKLVGHIDTDYDFGIIRCIFGFFIGFICYDLYLLIKPKKQTFDYLSTRMTVVEVCCVCLVVLFVSFCGNGPLTLLAPLIFGLTLLIFSFEYGLVSKILKRKTFLFIGMLSYSIYMIHTLVLLLMSYAVLLAERNLEIVLSTKGYFGAEMWQGDLFYGVLICLLLGTSYLTYNFIEAPGRKQSRRITDRIFSRTVSSNSESTRSARGEFVA
jgi:peptidoglycan/LPS O-acetylase OafA/YrhL